MFDVLSPFMELTEPPTPWNRTWMGDLVWYVKLCEMAGFCSTDDGIRLCARRWLSGKRKVTAPGTQRRKDAEKARRKLLAAVPQELLEALKMASQTQAAEQYRGGSEKALNSLIGFVMRRYVAATKVSAQVVRELLIETLNKKLAPSV
jgi:hypothetical protein